MTDQSGQPTVYCDVCIIGAGAAGIALAHRLRNEKLAIVLVESGPAQGDGLLFGGTLAGPGHPPLDLYRTRRFGGTTGLWGGRCLPLDPIDFEARPWVAYSGWPIGYADLAPHFAAALDYCEAGPWAFTTGEAMPDAPQAMVEGFDDPDLLSHRLERFSRPTDFAAAYGADLRASRNVRIMTDATCTRLLLDPQGRAVVQAELRLASGERQRIEARHFCVAAGGLETTRLLLESDDVLPGGIGQQRGLLGRFYMCHIEGKPGRLILDNPHRRVVADYERDRWGVYVRRRWTFSERLQREHRLLNMSLRFEPPPIADPAHRSSIYSAMFLSRLFIKEEYARRLAEASDRSASRHPAAVVGAHAFNLATGLPSLIRFAARWRRDHVRADRKLPFVLAPEKPGLYHIDFNAEQRPNPASRVSLDHQRDRDGLRRLQVDWRVLPEDLEDVVRGMRLAADRIAASGVGRLDFGADRIRQQPAAIGGHHIGTTRMAADPSQGVVDQNCRVFGIGNLFIASSSVMPTCGQANPTLTIVALALRLADHLVELARRPVFEAAENIVAARPATLMRELCRTCRRYVLPRLVLFQSHVERRVCSHCGHELEKVGA